jgi:hypothetical protein
MTYLDIVLIGVGYSLIAAFVWGVSRAMSGYGEHDFGDGNGVFVGLFWPVSAVVFLMVITIRTLHWAGYHLAKKLGA